MSAARPLMVVLLGAILLALQGSTLAQVPGRTIPEILADTGQSTAGAMGIPSGPPPAIAEVVADAELAVIGIVGEPTTYPSDDERDVYSDYPVLQPAVLYTSVSLVQHQADSPKITVTLLGGTIAVGGLSYTFTVEALPNLQPGGRCLLLLRRRHDGYRLAGGFYGAFEIQNDALIPLTRKQRFAPSLRDVPAATAIGEIVRQLQALRGPSRHPAPPL